MGEVRTLIFAVLLFVTVLTGMYYSYGSWYSNAAPSVSLSNSSINVTPTYLYFENWNNQTATILGNAQAVPIVGGSGLVLLAGLFQVLTFTVNLPNAVILPLTTSTLSALGIQLPWFVIFVTIGILTLFLIYIANAMKGTPI